MSIEKGKKEQKKIEECKGSKYSCTQHNTVRYEVYRAIQHCINSAVQYDTLLYNAVQHST